MMVKSTTPNRAKMFRSLVQKMKNMPTLMNPAASPHIPTVSPPAGFVKALTPSSCPARR
ncbi:hypothetical protein AB0B50_38560 [Streptomyces sp. NPDC041068]|uniref:hypothetical protein n=1 Tax=Streptomyces sp. NPDC041068 TaxID=3155130 RepID=UPI0033F8A67A